MGKDVKKIIVEMGGVAFLSVLRRSIATPRNVLRKILGVK